MTIDINAISTIIDIVANGISIATAAYTTVKVGNAAIARIAGKARRRRRRARRRNRRGQAPPA